MWNIKKDKKAQWSTYIHAIKSFIFCASLPNIYISMWWTNQFSVIWTHSRSINNPKLRYFGKSFNVNNPELDVILVCFRSDLIICNKNTEQLTVFDFANCCF